MELFVFGVHFSGTRVRGGRLHNQLYHLSESTPGMSLDVRGTINSLAKRTAAWFESVLRRPIVLHVWMHEGQAYAHRYEFADTHETLVQSFSMPAAPAGQYERVISEGHVRGRSWLQTAGLPAPDLCTAVHGDVEQAKLPDGVVLKEAGSLVADGHWYE